MINKNFKLSVLRLIYIICILLYLHYIINWGDILLANGNDSINDFVIDEVTQNNEESPSTYPIISPGILFRFRRKLSWYITGKNSGNFSSYDDFKASWVPKNTLWNEIKEDFNRTRFAAAANKDKSIKEGSELMNRINESRAKMNILNQKRRNIFNKTRGNK